MTERINPLSIDPNQCQARLLDGENKYHKKHPTKGSKQIWILAHNTEKQCKGIPTENNLCKMCNSHFTNFTTMPSNGDNNKKRYKWHNFITEEPPAYSHMFGTEWALKNIGSEPIPYVEKKLNEQPQILTIKQIRENILIQVLNVSPEKNNKEKTE